MIIVSNLKKSYDAKTVLSGINFTVYPGELIAVLGESGSGKSTLFKCLTLQEKWDDGRFLYHEKDLLAMDLFEKFKFRKEWSYIAEKPILNQHQTAVKNVLG